MELRDKLEQFGFVQSTADHCLFLKGDSRSFLALLVYIDDLLITGDDEKGIMDVKDYLNKTFTIKDLGFARYFLGLEILRDQNDTYVNERKYIMDILSDTGLMGSKPVQTPLPKGIKLSAYTGDPLPDPNRYRRLIGRLLYLSFTRPDVGHAVQQLSQYMGAPNKQHWEASLHVLRYLKGCPSKGLYFPISNYLQPQAYCDAGWASCLDTRRSLTGYCVFLGSALVSWKTKKQNMVSSSSAEAEYMSMGSTVREIKWLTYLLRDFRVSYRSPIELRCDNKAALHITANPVFKSVRSIWRWIVML